MKSGWPTKRLGELCVLTSGGTPPKDNPRFWDGDIPFVSARDLKSDSIKTAFLHISREAVEQSAAKMAPVGSLLMLVRGMGLANGIQIGEVTTPVAFNQDIRAIHPPLASVVPRFLLLALRSRFVYGDGGRVLSSAAHSTLKIDADVLRQILIPLPPIPEQHRIVAILDEAFAGIATAKANAEKNLQNAVDIFDKNLSQVFSGHHEGWKARRLDEVCTITSMLVDPRQPQYVDAIHVGAGNIESKTGMLIDLKTSGEEGLISGKFPFDATMVLYSKIRPYLEKVARP